MKNGFKDFPNSTEFTWTNGTGSAVAAGVPVRLPGGGVGVTLEAIANGATGTVLTRASVQLAKATGGGTALVQGQTVGWDFTNNRAERVGTINAPLALGVVAVAAADADATVVIDLNATGQAMAYIGRNPTAGEDTANAATWTTGVGRNPVAYGVTVFDNTGAVRAGTTVAWSNGVATITNTGLVATDTVQGWAIF
ncbi:MAG: DUF2190 family protein [Phycisphaerales bacterium]|nr:DUF2190 family protein [Phycisphaerales bacterium]